MRLHFLTNPIAMIPAAALVLAAPLFEAPTRPADELRFAPAEKTTLKKIYTTSMKTESTDFKFISDDQVVPLEEMGKPTIKIEDSTTIGVTDEYTKVGKGRPLELKRTFDKLAGKRSQTISGEDDESDGDTKEKSSKLEGKSVLFTWDPKAEEYKKKFAGDEGDKDLLAHIDEDMDFRAFLPEDASVKLTKDATWDLEAKVFTIVLSPGGDMRLRAEDDEDDNDKMDAEFEKNLSGKAKATYKGTREVDGKKLAVIAIKATLDTHGEDEKNGEEGRSRTEIRLGLELEGELLWDAAAGHMVHFEISGPVKMSVKMSDESESDGTHHSERQEIEFKGETKVEAKIET